MSKQTVNSLYRLYLGIADGTPIPAQRTCRRRCRCRADIAYRRPVRIRFVAYAKYWLTAMAGAHLLVLASGRFRSGRADRDGRGEAAAAPESGANGPASLPPPAVLETRSACSANKNPFLNFKSFSANADGQIESGGRRREGLGETASLGNL